MDFPGTPSPSSAQADKIGTMFARLADDLSDCHARRAALGASRDRTAEALDEINDEVDAAEDAMIEAMREHVKGPRSPGCIYYRGHRAVRVGDVLFILVEPGDVNLCESARVIVVPLAAIRGLREVANVEVGL